MKSDVVVNEVMLKMTNQEDSICLVVKEMVCDLVKDGVGEGVGVKGEDVRGALSLN